MTVFEKYSPGQFCWVDFVAHDMRAASRFYGRLFGWTAIPQDTHGGPPYTMFEKDGRAVAGLGQMPPEMKANGVLPMWNSYVSVADAEAIEERAKSLGATVTFATTPASSAGLMMYFDDPTGASLAVWQPVNHIGSGLANVPGSLAWNELATRDLGAARKFYAGLFGWTFDDAPDDPKMCIAKNAGRNNATLREMTEEWGDLPSQWTVYFAVEDVDQAAEKVVELGGAISIPATDIAPGRFAALTDPQGASFSIIALNPDDT